VMPPPPQGQAWLLADWVAGHPPPYPDLSGADSLSGDPAQIQEWVLDPGRVGPPLPLPPALPDVAALWARWLPRLEAFFAGTGGPATDIGWDELVAAALSVAPSAFLRADLARLTPLEISQMALAALPQEGSLAPRWALVAALRLLGFGAELLNRVDPSEPNQPAASVGQQLVSGAEEHRRKGLLLIYDDSLHPALLEPSRRRPVLLVPRSELARYQLGLQWLQDLDAFDGVLDQNG